MTNASEIQVIEAKVVFLDETHLRKSSRSKKIHEITKHDFVFEIKDVIRDNELVILRIYGQGYQIIKSRF